MFFLADFVHKAVVIRWSGFFFFVAVFNRKKQAVSNCLVFELQSNSTLRTVPLNTDTLLRTICFVPGMGEIPLYTDPR